MAVHGAKKQRLRGRKTIRRFRPAPAGMLRPRARNGLRGQLTEIAPRNAAPTGDRHRDSRNEPPSDAPPTGCLTLDPEGRILDVDASLADFLRSSRNDLVGRILADWVPQSSRSALHRFRNRMNDAAAGACQLMDLLRGDGSKATVCLTAFPPSPGTGSRRQVAVTDIGGTVLVRRCIRIASRLQDPDSFLEDVTREIRAFLGCDGVGIRLLDAEGRIPFLAWDGFGPAFTPGESRPALRQDRCLCTDVVRGSTDPCLPFSTAIGSLSIGSRAQLRETLPGPLAGSVCDACRRVGHESMALVPIAHGERRVGLIHASDKRPGMFPPGVVELLEDVATVLAMVLQREADHTLMEESLQELQYISSKLLLVQEEEQRRISMELHDHAGQNLTFLKFQLSNLADRLPKRSKRLETEFGKLLSLMDTIIDEMRRLSHGLSPSILENLGLYAALGSLVDDFKAYSGIETTADLQGLGDLLFDPQTQIAVYRIVQELLSNVRKHADARTVSIQVERTPCKLIIRIQDDGKGFRLKPKPAPDGLERGMGLATMQLRARVIGATLLFNSRIGHGTETLLTVPIDQEARR